MELEPRKPGIGRGVNVGVALIVAQQHVITRLVPFDQAVLEDECLGLRICDRHLHAGYLLHHCCRLW